MKSPPLKQKLPGIQFAVQHNLSSERGAVDLLTVLGKEQGTKKPRPFQYKDRERDESVVFYLGMLFIRCLSILYTPVVPPYLPLAALLRSHHISVMNKRTWPLIKVFALHGNYPSVPTYLLLSIKDIWKFSSASRSRRGSGIVMPFRTCTLFRIAVGYHIPYYVRSTRVSLFDMYRSSIP